MSEEIIQGKETHRTADLNQSPTAGIISPTDLVLAFLGHSENTVRKLPLFRVLWDGNQVQSF